MAGALQHSQVPVVVHTRCRCVYTYTYRCLDVSSLHKVACRGGDTVSTPGFAARMSHLW